MEREILDTHQKAFQLNMDLSKYGTFAEIGAGQEVARSFFRVGGASVSLSNRCCHHRAKRQKELRPYASNPLLNGTSFLSQRPGPPTL